MSAGCSTPPKAPCGPCNDEECDAALCRLGRLEEDVRTLQRWANASTERETLFIQWRMHVHGKVNAIRRALRRYKVYTRQHRAHLMHMAKGETGTSTTVLLLSPCD